VRAWAVKGPDGIWLSSIERTKRSVERQLCQEYTGAEWSWSPGYAELFEDDLRNRLETDELQIVEVEIIEI
jgi:hypothetical protein